MAYRRHRKNARNSSVELDITAFMNLMVVLVPFLLMTAVFTSISVLDLKLPAADKNSSSNDLKPSFDLSVTIRDDAMILSDQTGLVIKHIPKMKSGHNFILLNQTLRLVKNKFPDKTSISILSEKLTPYDDIIHVMDKVREFQAALDGKVITYELFPNISIGDAANIRNENLKQQKAEK